LEGTSMMDRRRIAIEDVNYLAVNVMELRRAEQFYTDLFEMEVVARTRSEPDGSYRLLSPDYSPDEAVLRGEEADDSFLRNGPLTIALHRVGAGARLERSLLDRVSIRVDGQTFNRLRGIIMMRQYEMLGGGTTYFSFRDPYGVPWEITVPGALPEIIQSTLAGHA
jgi:catechol 2,3-dioxygenase-like lactoylglutathione lyase family enzyme